MYVCFRAPNDSLWYKCSFFKNNHYTITILRSSKYRKNLTTLYHGTTKIAMFLCYSVEVSSEWIWKNVVYCLKGKFDRQEHYFRREIKLVSIVLSLIVWIRKRVAWRLCKHYMIKIKITEYSNFLKAKQMINKQQTLVVKLLLILYFYIKKFIRFIFVCL